MGDERETRHARDHEKYRRGAKTKAAMSSMPFGALGALTAAAAAVRAEFDSCPSSQTEAVDQAIGAYLTELAAVLREHVTGADRDRRDLARLRDERAIVRAYFGAGDEP